MSKKFVWNRGDIVITKQNKQFLKAKRGLPKNPKQRSLYLKQIAKRKILDANELTALLLVPIG